METILAKLYIGLVFIILLIITIFLIVQIQLKQNLEKNLTGFQSQINKKSYESQFKLGQIYLRKKIYNKAIAEFRECFSIWDKNDRLGLASLLNTLGFTYFNLKQYEIAKYYYKIALSLTPDYFISLTNLAYLYQSQGQIDELDDVYKKLKKLDSNNPKTLEIRNYLNGRTLRSE